MFPQQGSESALLIFDLQGYFHQADVIPLQRDSDFFVAIHGSLPERMMRDRDMEVKHSDVVVEGNVNARVVEPSDLHFVARDVAKG